LLPATFMEYVPADFDEEQEKRAKTALDAIAAKLTLPKERVTTAALAVASITSFCATRPSGARTSSSWVRTGR